MKIQFDLEDILSTYGKISKLDESKKITEVSTLSHELRGPYNNIIGLSDLINNLAKTKDYENIKNIAISSNNSIRKLRDLTESNQIYIEGKGDKANDAAMVEAANILNNLSLILQEKINKKYPDVLIDKEVSLLEFSRDTLLSKHNMHFNPVMEKAEYLLNQGIKNYVTAISENSPIKFEMKLNDEFSSNYDYIKVAISPLLDNLPIHAFKGKLDNPAFQPVCKITTAPDIFKGKFIVRIEDNGNGIDPSIQDRLFEYGATTSEIKKEDKDKHGEGLYYIKKKLEENNASINFKSNYGKGTKFEIRIPYKRKEAFKIYYQD